MKSEIYQFLHNLGSDVQMLVSKANEEELTEIIAKLRQCYAWAESEQRLRSQKKGQDNE